jgi:hypothetical protein
MWPGIGKSFMHNGAELRIDHNEWGGTLSVLRSCHVITDIRYRISDNAFMRILDFCASELCNPYNVYMVGEYRVHLGGNQWSNVYWERTLIRITRHTETRTLENNIGLRYAALYVVKLKLVLERLLTEYGIDFPESELHGMMATNMVKNAAAVH